MPPICAKRRDDYVAIRRTYRSSNRRPSPPGCLKGKEKCPHHSFLPRTSTWYDHRRRRRRRLHHKNDTIEPR
uniref:Uncharacterized protein n=1 Tax=Anopheles atroparvus TaxID=41427 RepID=A0AAG5DK56_ANOAO